MKLTFTLPLFATIVAALPELLVVGQPHTSPTGITNSVRQDTLFSQPRPAAFEVTNNFHGNNPASTPPILYGQNRLLQPDVSLAPAFPLRTAGAPNAPTARQNGEGRVSVGGGAAVIGEIMSTPGGAELVLGGGALLVGGVAAAGVGIYEGVKRSFRKGAPLDRCGEAKGNFDKCVDEAKKSNKNPDDVCASLTELMKEACKK